MTSTSKPLERPLPPSELDGSADEPSTTWAIELEDEVATADLGRFIAEELKPGDLLTLSGELGTGKTALARAVIRTLAGDDRLEVPSPTFTLMQSYETRRGLVVHADLYRLRGTGELDELGWDEVGGDAILVVEWPERAGVRLPSSRLDVAFALSPTSPEARFVTLRAGGAFAARLLRARATRDLLERAGWEDADREHLQGDASTRAYERLTRPSGESAILMVSPPRADGPPIRGGRPYSAIARLAESVHAFVAMDRGLRAIGLSAPRILAEDLGTGLLLLEDLGTEPFADQDGPIPDRYAAAVQLLAKLHATELPPSIPVTEDRAHHVPPYDLEALQIEVELLPDWYVPHGGRPPLPGAAKADFLRLWGESLAEVVAAPVTWTLRDFHSPNLIWLPQRMGIKRVGLLDFQDAVLGHPAYDVVSLLQDARVTVPPELEIRLLGLYARERKAAQPGFDMAGFAEAYAILGAQRATKVLGIFARLDRRDGKPAYLRHLPRVEAYLRRNLAHPVLATLRGWYEAHVPGLAPTDDGADPTA